MQQILITGATGNVGEAVIANLRKKTGDFQIIVGLRERTDHHFSEMTDLKTIHFDFSDLQSVRTSLRECDVLFLLRPPQLSDVKTYFEPLINIAVDEKVGHIVFLSVQGADTNSFIPHHKIEKLIKRCGISYTFLRPAYFMQKL